MNRNTENVLKSLGRSWERTWRVGLSWWQEGKRVTREVVANFKGARSWLQVTERLSRNHSGGGQGQWWFSFLNSWDYKGREIYYLPVETVVKIVAISTGNHVFGYEETENCKDNFNDMKDFQHLKYGLVETEESLWRSWSGRHIGSRES